MRTHLAERRCATTILGACTALLLAACSGDGGGTGPPVDLPVDAASATVGPTGGAVSSGAVSLEVPAGALASDVTLTLSQAASPAAIGGTVTLGPTVEIGPTGTAFAVPARVTLPWVPGALPSGAAADDVRLYTAGALGEPFTALVSEVDPDAGTVSAEVDHLSVFVPAVPAGAGDGFLCPTHGECDCDGYFADRPATVLATATLEPPLEPLRGRLIHAMAYQADTDTLVVSSYTLPPEPDCSDGCTTEELTPSPVDIYRTVLDGASLAVLSEDTVEMLDLEAEGAAAAPSDRNTLGGTDSRAGRSWSVRVEPVPDNELTVPPPIRYYEEVLRVGGLKLSFNRHLNQTAPYTDTNSLFDNGANSAEAHFIEGGAARFYFYSWFGEHIDVIHVDDLDALEANAADLADADGYVEPDFVERLELAPGDHRFAYSYDALQLTVAPDDPRADVLLAFSRVDTGLQGFRVWRDPVSGLQIDPLTPPSFDTYYAQFGWDNGGVDASGRLLLQSHVAGFTNSQMLALDPGRFEVVGAWEMGCMGPPYEGFTTIPWATGQAFRTAFETTGFPGDRVMFVSSGRTQAVAEVPHVWVLGEPLVVLTDSTTRRAYVADHDTGVITALAVPPP